MINSLAVQFAVLSLLVNLSYAAQWTPGDMNPGKLPQPNDTKMIKPDCDGTPCGYEIHYFTTQASTPDPKTILYISGGPGQIVPRDRPNLHDLKDTFNIVYFDIRGAGLSSPQKGVDNSTDRFLRAKYVVKDIEEIRKKVLVDKPWDAIYGHSAGTVFAQMYAEQFGKITPTNNKVAVKSLILSAPISRHKDNDRARAQQIATNLQNILENINDVECPFKQTDEPFHITFPRLANALTPIFIAGLFTDRPDALLTATNNFCFLDSTRVKNIKLALENKLELMSNYGSITFVLENHKELATADKALTRPAKRFQDDFPYPDMFFFSLRQLDRLGSPKKKSSDQVPIIRTAQVDAALVLGYYLDSPLDAVDTGSTKCNPKAPFLRTLNSKGVDTYCRRFGTIPDHDKKLEEARSSTRSERTANVLGINEGIHRWAVKLMAARPEGCNRGEEFLAFASNPGSDKKTTARNIAGRVGFVANEYICAWDPAKHKQDIPTLILKGSQDAAIHGCQAEHFFREGLLHAKKEFIEFQDLGHDWISEIKPDRKGDLTTLLAKFIHDPNKFRGTGGVDETTMTRLNAKWGTPASFAEAGCTW